MATTYNHCQIAIVDASGNVSVIYPITQAQDVSVVRTSNANLPTTVTTAQKLANALGALAFKNVADIISTDGATTSTTKTWSSSVINTKLTELSSNINELNSDLNGIIKTVDITTQTDGAGNAVVCGIGGVLPIGFFSTTSHYVYSFFWAGAYWYIRLHSAYDYQYNVIENVTEITGTLYYVKI